MSSWTKASFFERKPSAYPSPVNSRGQKTCTLFSSLPLNSNFRMLAFVNPVLSFGKMSFLGESSQRFVYILKRDRERYIERYSIWISLSCHLSSTGQHDLCGYRQHPRFFLWTGFTSAVHITTPGKGTQQRIR